METLRLSDLETESEKTSFGRLLHDEVGGLLVGAIMDMSWIAQQGGLSEPVANKVVRAIGLLREAIGIKRKLVEVLRPSMLDVVGLCSTLGWHFRSTCDDAGVPYSEHYPSEEPPLSADFKIGMFRIFQRALSHCLAVGAPGGLALRVEFVGNHLHWRMTSHFTQARSAAGNAAGGLTPLHHRVRQRGGCCEYVETAEAGHLTLSIPLPRECAQSIPRDRDGPAPEGRLDS